MPSILGANSVSGDLITNSLCFNDGDSARLARAQANGNQDKWTWSGWVKRSTLGAAQCFFATTDGSATSFDAKFDGSDNLDVYNYLGGGFGARLITNRVFRDVAAWYHIVIVYDSGNGTEANRLRIYVNGTEETSFSTTNYPSQNEDSDLNVSGSDIEIGRQANGSQFFDGYMAEMFLLDGQAKAPTDFGETDSNGVWVPKEYTGGSFGTNGFHLQFKQTGTSANAAGIGADTSGNGNHFAVSNLAAIDVGIDTPFNNFATLDPTNNFASPAVSEGNLEFDSNSSSGCSMVSTIAPSNGKWYAEAKIAPAASAGAVVAVAAGVSEVGKESFNVKGQGASRPNVGYNYGDNINTNVEIDGSLVDTESQYRAGDIVGIALNLDDGEVTFYLNGTAINSGTAYNLHTNSTHESTGFSVQTHTGGGNQIVSYNFGNPAFAISSGNSDANGYGNFEYSVPSGYFALCTKNLAEYG